jgi:hypothetical protein
MDFCNLLQSVAASPPAAVEREIVNPATDAGKVSGTESVSLYFCFRTNDSSSLSQIQCLEKTDIHVILLQTPSKTLL